MDANKLTAVDETNLGDTYLLNFTRGNKLFELTNHLGNVLTVLSDKKMGRKASDPSMIGIYDFDMVTASDYTPFGMVMQGRNFSFLSRYRYGFNGKEYDNEFKGAGNLLDYGNRLYDPLAGRFMSVDPLTKAYPELTPYQFASNRPIDGIDIDGLEVIQYTLAKQGVYGPTAAKIINGTEDGVKASLKNTWNFFAKDAWRAQTWINAGKFIEQGALSMSAVPVAPTPMIDAKADEFINDVVRGDAYSRSAYISEFGTTLLTGYISDKGLGKIKSIAIGKYMSGTFTIGSKTLAKVTDHLEGLGLGFIDDAGNQVMLKRLESIAKKEMKATEIDINFAKHELREAEFMKKGITQEEAHTSVLKEQNMYHPGYEKKLYTQDAIDASKAQWEREIKNK